MHLFLSAGEPSGELHGANLAKILFQHDPHAKIVGLGGDRMAEAGVEVQYPLTDLAVMWLGKALVHLPEFLHLTRRAEHYFRTQKPDALVVIDYPGFHWSLAKRAHRHGIPVYYFVPPQLWAWAGWRVSKMRKWVKTVLTALPFEDEWYSSRGVNTHYIGHPYFDELSQQKPDVEFIRHLQADGSPLIALLPGSRTQEVISNFPLILQAAAMIRQAMPNARFVVAAYKRKLANMCREMMATSGVQADIQIQKMPEILEASKMVLAVSGSVSLEMLYRTKPSVVVYRINRASRFISKQFMTCDYISLVNLLAQKEVFPEFLTVHDNAAELAAPIIRWLREPAAYEASRAELRALREKVAVPGACERAAAFLIEELRRK
ncbi:MAG: lipid-A-disaccharide synthase [Fimbriiglobus sp.]